MTDTPEQNNANSASPATEGSDVDRSVRHYCSFCGREKNETRAMIVGESAAICFDCTGVVVSAMCDEGIINATAYLFKVRDETGATKELREFAALDFSESPGQTVLSKQPLFMMPNAEVSGPPQRTEPQETRHE